MSDFQRAMQTVEDCVKRYGDEVDWMEWQRVRATLTPDREMIRAALKDAVGDYLYGFELDAATTAAIDAARGAK